MYGIREEVEVKERGHIASLWWGDQECATHEHDAGQDTLQNDLWAHPTRLNTIVARAVEGNRREIQYYHKNYLDHVYAVTDRRGRVLEHYRYTAFGEVEFYAPNGTKRDATAIDNHVLWNSRRYDQTTNLHYYKYRHYSPELGRWLSRDPIEEDGGINLYNFVGNDSLNNWDVLGENIFTDLLDWAFGDDSSVSVGDTHDKWTHTNTKGTFQGLIDEINKQAKDCCIDELTISNHGNPSVMDLSPNIKRDVLGDDPEKATRVDDSNAKALFKKLDDKVTFCKECTIYMLSCNTGLGSIPQELANATGCTVFSPIGYVYSREKNPEKSKIVPSTETNPAYPGSGNTFKEFKPNNKPVTPFAGNSKSGKKAMKNKTTKIK